MHPEDRRAARLARIREERETPGRLEAIEEVKARNALKPRRAPSSTRKTRANSADFFGHPWDEWDAMVDAAEAHIRARAAARRTTTYGEVWNAVSDAVGRDLGNPWRRIDHVLGSVVERWVESESLVPTALVIHEVGPEGPGPGFFRIAADCDLFPWRHVPPEGEPYAGMTPEQRVFWEEQVQKLFARYGEGP